MQKNENIVRYTAAELDKKFARGEDMTDWAYVDALTEEEIEASIDWEDEGRFEWGEPYPHGFPAVMRKVTIGLDAMTVAWYKAGGDDYRERIRFALRDYVDAQAVKLAAEPRPRRRQVS